MKYLNSAKIFISVLLITVGLSFGYRMFKDTIDFPIINNTAISIPNNVNIQTESTATYTPIYAGICIIAGVYLLSKVERE